MNDERTVILGTEQSFSLTLTSFCQSRNSFFVQIFFSAWNLHDQNLEHLFQTLRRPDPQIRFTMIPGLYFLSSASLDANSRASAAPTWGKVQTSLQ